MSKKIISLLLSFMLTVSMVAVAAVSVSAEVDGQNRYTPSESVDTNRYYFYMPFDWYNDCAFDAGIYWWLGADAPSGWPGYNAQFGDAEQVYYCDVPVDATTIIWNNGFDGGDDSTDPDYSKAIQTVDIPCEFYADGDSDIYDSAWLAEMETLYNEDKTALGNFADNFFYDEVYDAGFSFNFDNMIFVINPNMVSENEHNGKIVSGGEWFFYYGFGEYGTYPTREMAAEKGTLYTSDYQPAKERPATEPVTEETTNAEITTEPTTATEATEETTVPEVIDETTPYITVNATSNYFPKATAEYNSTTKEVVVKYLMQSKMDVLDLQWSLTYDSDILTLADSNNENTVCPVIADKGVLNTTIKNCVKYNASNLNLFDFSSEKVPFVEIVFNVNDLKGKTPAITTVDLNVEVLRVSEINEETLRSDESKEIILINNGKVLSSPETEKAGVEVSTELTPSTFATPTDPVETTEEPTTEEPTTEEPTTEEPTTEEPTTEAPTTIAPTEPATKLKVTATSNYFPSSQTFIKEGEQYVTVTYFVDSKKDLLETQWELKYDPSVLQYDMSLNMTEDGVNNHMPLVGDTAYVNDIKDDTNASIGKIKGVCTNVKLFKFANKGRVPFVTSTFKVVGSGETTVDLFVNVLTFSLRGADFYTDPEQEDVVVNFGEINNKVAHPDRDTVVHAGLYDPTATNPEVPATEEPTTEPATEPATEAPTTDPATEPATEAPTTVPTTEPATEAPTTVPTTEPATEAPTTVPTTEPVTELPTETPTEPVTEQPTETPTEPITPEPTMAPPAPTDPVTEIKDSATGITVIGNLPINAELVVKPVKVNISDVAVAYEVSVVVNGEVVQPTGEITVLLPYDKEGCTVVSVNDDSSTEVLESKYEDGNYVLTVSNLSKFAIIAPSSTDPTSATGTSVTNSTGDTPERPNNNAVQTGDSSFAVIILVILIGATSVMFVLRKREMF